MMFKSKFFISLRLCLMTLILCSFQMSEAKEKGQDQFQVAKQKQRFYKAKKGNEQKELYQVAACLFFQNEAPYLKEWIEYHRTIGVEHFYLFNNESTDDYVQVLAPYIKQGIVELKNIHGFSSNFKEQLDHQYTAYREALRVAKGKVKWLAFIDADEFILPIQENHLMDVLKDFEEYGGVYANWLMFGTSGHKTIPSGQLMIEALTFGMLEVETLGKSIVRPERVSYCSDVHRFFYHPPYVHVNTNHETFDWLCPKVSDRLVINHYYTRDEEHLINVKYPRRKKWQNCELNDYIQLVNALNVVEYSTIQKFVPELRRRMNLD